MPRGGWRGGGRPSKAAQAEKERLLGEAIANGLKTPPRVLLQGIMSSTGSTRMEKLKACELYMKLPPEAEPARSADKTEVSLIPYAVPRGSSIDMETGKIIFPEGIEPEPIEPYTGTKDWTQTAASKREPVVERADDVVVETPIEQTEPLPVRTMDPAPNVQRLRPRERTYSEGARHDSSRRPSAMSPFTYKPPGDPFDAA
jgi:hypothetical protein